MINFDSFKLLCFVHQLDVVAIESCREFLKQHNHNFHEPGDPVTFSDTRSLGYAELSDIDTVEKAIQELAKIEKWAVCDFDSMGRNLEKMRRRQFQKDPGKAYKRRLLKYYYLLDGQPIN